MTNDDSYDSVKMVGYYYRTGLERSCSVVLMRTLSLHFLAVTNNILLEGSKYVLDLALNLCYISVRPVVYSSNALRAINNI